MYRQRGGHAVAARASLRKAAQAGESYMAGASAVLITLPDKASISAGEHEQVLLAALW